MEFVSLGFANVYGPWQDPHGEAGVVAIFTQLLLRGVTPTIYGDGTITRDFVYVSDVVEANIRAAAVAGVAGMVFNIATGNTVTLNELLEMMCGICGLEFQPVYGDARPGDIRHSAAAIDRARELLDWRPVVSLDDGLAALLNSLGIVV